MQEYDLLHFIAARSVVCFRSDTMTSLFGDTLSFFRTNITHHIDDGLRADKRSQFVFTIPVLTDEPLVFLIQEEA